MTAALSEAQWIESIEKHYLEDFIPTGGSAVKFAACFPPVEPVELGWKLRDLAHGKGLLVSEVDASTCRVHMVNQFLGRIADQIPWTQISERILASYARKNHWAVPDDFTSEGLAEQIAQANQRSVQAISNVLEGEIDQGTLPDRQMAKDFRTAMFHLLRARLFSGAASETKQRHISDWLGGRTLAMSELRNLQIFSKVNRTNARHLLGSLIYWIRKAGFAGIAVVVNGSRLVATSRFTEGVNYTKASRIEAYQVFREFIDSIDEFDGLLLTVIMPQDFLALEPYGRGLGSYPALFYRVYDEVRDQNLPNPLTTLARIGASTGVST